MAKADRDLFQKFVACFNDNFDVSNNISDLKPNESDVLTKPTNSVIRSYLHDYGAVDVSSFEPENETERLVVTKRDGIANVVLYLLHSSMLASDFEKLIKLLTTQKVTQWLQIVLNDRPRQEIDKSPHMSEQSSQGLAASPPSKKAKTIKLAVIALELKAGSTFGRRGEDFFETKFPEFIKQSVHPVRAAKAGAQSTELESFSAASPMPSEEVAGSKFTSPLTSVPSAPDEQFTKDGWRVALGHLPMTAEVTAEVPAGQDLLKNVLASGKLEWQVNGLYAEFGKDFVLPAGQDLLFLLFHSLDTPLNFIPAVQAMLAFAKVCTCGGFCVTAAGTETQFYCLAAQDMEPLVSAARNLLKQSSRMPAVTFTGRMSNAAYHSMASASDFAAAREDERRKRAIASCFLRSQRLG